MNLRRYAVLIGNISVICSFAMALALHASEVLDGRYFQNGFYATVFRLLIVDIDRFLLLFCIIGGLTLALHTCTRWINPRARRRLYLLMVSILAMAVAYAAFRRLQPLLQDQSFAAGLRAALGMLCVLVAAAAAVLAGGRYYLRRHGRLRDSAPLDKTGKAMLPRISVFREVDRGLISAPILSLILLPLLVLVNLAYVGDMVSTSRALRDRPNIVLIVIDTTRADHMGCYGYKYSTTPCIDKFARTATIYRNAISQAPFTAWSVSSFMTSQYPESFDYEHHKGLASLAEALREMGYRTGGMVGSPFLVEAQGFAQGFKSYDLRASDRMGNSPEVTDESLKWIEANRAANFFLLSYFMGPHSPYVLRQKYEFPGYDPSLPREMEPHWNRPRNAHELAHMESLYDSNIAFTDANVGRLLDGLKSKGLYENSIIVITADHGEEFMDHGSYFHGQSLHRELINVPLIIKLPHQLEGSQVHTNARLIDLFPSIMSLLHYSTRRMNLCGRSFDLTRPTESDTYTYSASEYGVHLRGVQTEKYKYVLDLNTSKGTLYDLDNDRLELHDVSSSNREEAERLNRVLMTHEVNVNGLARREIIPTADHVDKDRLKLRSLGYLR